MEQSDGTFSKIAMMTNGYFMRPAAYDVIADIQHLLNEIISFTCMALKSADSSAAVPLNGKSAWKKGETFRTVNEKTKYTLAQINIPASRRWEDSGIFNTQIETSGVFESFEDFSKGKIIEKAFSLAHNEKDSTYSLPQTDSLLLLSNGKIWGLKLNNQYYFHLGLNSFVKLARMDNTFEFYIPYKFPGAYALFSFLDHQRLSRYSFPASGNIPLNLAGIGITGIMDLGETSGYKRSVRESPLYNEFRYCKLNMESGDIMY
jgi:hypothetical protein